MQSVDVNLKGTQTPHSITQVPVNHLIDAGEHVITHTEDKVSATINHTTDALGSFFSSLSMPLMIGGAVVLVIILKK